ncbi:MAG: cupredoxin domain-containing protein [Gemmataceae bacterium]|nr:cupredoxin domain-containing protein [Gemmataceae bacterium]
MPAVDLLVAVAGLALIAWVNWYFFLAGQRAVQASSGSSGRQEVTVTVRGGYEPSAVRVQAGQPLSLVFDRQESSGCSEEVVIRDFGVRRYLPAFQKTAVELTPSGPGTHEFTCGMGMLRGRLIVE